jgi:endonuclease III related protein
MYPCQNHFSSSLFTEVVKEVFEKLYNHFGPQKWWPAETPFEVIIGAILTQSINWKNAEKAIINLKNNNLLSPEALRNINKDKLALHIKSTGYYNIKAEKVKAFVEFLFDRYNGNLNYMFKTQLFKLREELLMVYGIGPETADSILLYAGQYSIFVIDAYTKRIFSRVGIVKVDVEYKELQKKIMDVLETNQKLYNEYHALLVVLGKEYCFKKRPKCDTCPLAQ